MEACVERGRKAGHGLSPLKAVVVAAQGKRETLILPSPHHVVEESELYHMKAKTSQHIKVKQQNYYL